MSRSAAFRSAGLLTIVLLLGAGACAPPRAVAGESEDTVAAYDRLVDALARFRGTGDPSVTAYRVELRVPDEEEESPPLVEMWRAPSDLALRAAQARIPVAVVRGLAIYLEPLYVARSSFLQTDLESSADRVRTIGAVSVERCETGGETVRVALPTPADEALPGPLREVIGLEANLDANGRLTSLAVDLREAGADGGPGCLELSCTWGESPLDPQPAVALWTLPGGDRVTVRTEFRDEADRRVPATRHVTFPSRYDPGDVERIEVEYGRYEFEPDFDAAAFESAGTFRYGANGLIEE